MTRKRIRGLGRKIREEIGKRNQMTALRFQTGKRLQTSPASHQGGKSSGSPTFNKGVENVITLI